MKLIKLLILVISLFIFISTTESSAQVSFGTYINLFKEKKKLQQKLKIKVAEYKKKLQRQQQG
jgi:Skp family chaperone for outer membrane proteins